MYGLRCKDIYIYIYTYTPSEIIVFVFMAKCVTEQGVAHLLHVGSFKHCEHVTASREVV